MLGNTEEKQPLTVDETAKAHMLEIGRWGKFLAIVTFVMLALMILIGLIFAFAFPSMPAPNGANIPGVILAFVYLFIAALYVYPVYALYKYSVLVKQAIAEEDQFTFNRAFGYLKGSFKYIGIMMLVVICIYALMFVFGGVAAIIAGTFS